MKGAYSCCISMCADMSQASPSDEPKESILMCVRKKPDCSSELYVCT